MSEKSDNLKVFISYSRVDTRFASELVDGLEALGGFDVYIDKHAIKEGEEWKPHLLRTHMRRRKIKQHLAVSISNQGPYSRHTTPAFHPLRSGDELS